jgi:hypothetical protein
VPRGEPARADPPGRHRSGPPRQQRPAPGPVRRAFPMVPAADMPPPADTRGSAAQSRSPGAGATAARWPDGSGASRSKPAAGRSHARSAFASATRKSGHDQLVDPSDDPVAADGGHTTVPTSDRGHEQRRGRERLGLGQRACDPAYTRA